MAKVAVLDSFSHLSLGKELKRTHQLQRDSPLPKNEENSPQRILTDLDRISSLDMLVTEMVQQCTLRSLDLVENLPNFQEAPFAKVSLTSMTEKCWDWVRQSMQMAELHVKNASAYQQYHNTAINLSQFVTTEISNPPPMEQLSQGTVLERLSFLVMYLEERLTSHLSTWKRVDNLLNLSRGVVPIAERRPTGPSATTRIRAQWLCNYTNTAEDIVLRPEDLIIVVDRSRPDVWRVETRTGRQFEAPSFVCLLPGPDYKAVEHAHRVREMFGKIWKNTLFTAWPYLLGFFRTILHEYLENNVYFEKGAQETFANLLNYFDKHFVPKFITEPDSHWVEAKENAFDQLTAHQASAARPRSGEGVTLTSEHMTNLTSVLNLFKEHTKNERLLRNQISSTELASNGETRPENRTDLEKLLTRSRPPSSLSTASGSTDSSIPLTNCFEGRRIKTTFHTTLGDYGNPVFLTHEQNDDGKFLVDVDTEGQRYTSTKSFQLNDEGELFGAAVRRFEVSRYKIEQRSVETTSLGSAALQTSVTQTFPTDQLDFTTQTSDEEDYEIDEADCIAQSNNQQMAARIEEEPGRKLIHNETQYDLIQTTVSTLFPETPLIKIDTAVQNTTRLQNSIVQTENLSKPTTSQAVQTFNDGPECSSKITQTPNPEPKLMRNNYIDFVVETANDSNQTTGPNLTHFTSQISPSNENMWCQSTPSPIRDSLVFNTAQFISTETQYESTDKPPPPKSDRASQTWMNALKVFGQQHRPSVSEFSCQVEKVCFDRFVQSETTVMKQALVYEREDNPRPTRDISTETNRIAFAEKAAQENMRATTATRDMQTDRRQLVSTVTGIAMKMEAQAVQCSFKVPTADEWTQGESTSEVSATMMVKRGIIDEFRVLDVVYTGVYESGGAK